jgi:DNA-binding MarR family transcriptional regulator
VTSTMRDGRTHPTTARQALVDRMAELKPTLDRKMRVRLPDDLRADLQSVTLHQLDALSLLDRGGLRMSELARELDVSEPASTALADRLVRAGLVERHTDADDRRIVRLELSRNGRDLMSRWGSHRRRMMTATFEVLSDRQLAALIDILETLASDAPAGGAASGKERTT